MMNRPPDDEVAFAIELTNLCEQLHSLPRAGGILDQDYYHIVLIKAGLRAFNMKREADSKHSMPQQMPKV